jgi:hypothetical protein
MYAVIIFTSQHLSFTILNVQYTCKSIFYAKCFSGKITEFLFALISYVLIHRELFVEYASQFLCPRRTNECFFTVSNWNGSIIPPIYPVYVELLWELICLRHPLTADSLERLNASRSL